MVDYKYKDLFYDRSVKKSLWIYNDDETLVLTNSDIHYESFELTESICSEQNLVFGSCEPSMVKFRVSNIVTSLKNQWLTVSETLEGGADEPFLFGRYKVFSDELTSDRKYRDITAYDALHDALEADLTAWYNTLLPNDDSEVTQKQFRDSLFEFLGIEQEDIVLPNDDMIIQRTIQPEQLFGFDVLTALCEINGSFGHIGRNGKFQYILLKEIVEGVYPSDEVPKINADYEDFVTARITKLQIRQEENDIGVSYGTGNNCYVVQDNFLLYGKGTEELQVIAAKLYSVISKVWYRPATVNAKGNPCLEVGDAIKVSTANADIYTYIFQRTLKGIQALRDTYDAEGEQYQTEKVNSVQNQIIQLKGKSNVLERTIEETKLTISDVGKGLQTQITQNSESISTEVTRATKAEGDLSTRITQTANSFSVEINNLQNQIDGNIMTYNLNYVPTLTNYPAWDWTYNIPCNNTVQLRDDLQFEYKDEYWRKNARSVVFNTETFVTYRFLEKDGVWGWIEVADSEYSYVLQQISELKLTDESITLSVSKLEEEIIADYSTKVEVESQIQQMADSITLSVSKTYETKNNASSQYTALSSRITQTADSITTEVKRAQTAEDTLSSRITQNANAINLRVQKGSIISEINQTAESVTIKAAKIDLAGLVSATEFTSKFATIDTLNASIARIATIEANYASVNWVNANFFTADEVRAEIADVESLFANYATISQLNAVDAQFSNLNANNITAGTMSVDRIDLTGLSSKVINVNTLIAASRVTSSYMNATTFNCDQFNGKYPTWETITINGTSYTVLTA